MALSVTSSRAAHAALPSGNFIYIHNLAFWEVSLPSLQNIEILRPSSASCFFFFSWKLSISVEPLLLPCIITYLFLLVLLLASILLPSSALMCGYMNFFSVCPRLTQTRAPPSNCGWTGCWEFSNILRSHVSSRKWGLGHHEFCGLMQYKEASWTPWLHRVAKKNFNKWMTLIIIQSQVLYKNNY